MCRARKTMVMRARLRWRLVVRNRGQPGLCMRSAERMHRTTTALSRIKVTAPAPRVVYQRTLLDTGQWEAPETATPPPDEELTPLEDCSPLDEEEEVEEVDVLAEVEVLEVDDVAVSLDAEVELVP